MDLIIMLSSGVLFGFFWCCTIKKSEVIPHNGNLRSRKLYENRHFSNCVKDSERVFRRFWDVQASGCTSRSAEEKTVSAACFEPSCLPFGDSLLKLQRMSQRASSLQEPLLLRVQSGFILSVSLRASLEGKRSLLLFVLSVMTCSLHGNFMWNRWNPTNWPFQGVHFPLKAAWRHK